MKSLLILLCFAWLAPTALAQAPVTISGKLKMKPGTTLRVSCYRDYFSLEKERLATVQTRSDSSFSVNFSLSSPQIVSFSVNELSLEALLYPGKRYQLDLFSSQNEHKGSLLMKTADDTSNPQEILLQTYRIFADSTLAILFKQNNQRASKAEVERFNHAIDQALKQTPDSICKTLIQSTRVDYLVMSRAVNFESALETFFDCSHLQLENPGLQSLLVSRFKLYFSSGPPAITRLNLFQGIPDSLNFSKLMLILTADPSLKCVPVRESVLISNLFGLWKNGVLTTNRSMELLNEASTAATHPFNRKLATWLIQTIHRQQNGAVVPDFQLIYPDGSQHSLSNFVGKPLHLTFFTLSGSSDRIFLSQLAVTQHFTDSLGVAHLVCVTTDPDRQAVAKYWHEKKYPMQLCFAPDDYEMIDFFNAYADPTFVLLDSKGHLNTLAPNFPGEQLLKQLVGLYQADHVEPAPAKSPQKTHPQQDGQFLPGSPRPLQQPRKKS